MYDERVVLGEQLDSGYFVSSAEVVEFRVDVGHGLLESLTEALGNLFVHFPRSQYQVKHLVHLFRGKALLHALVEGVPEDCDVVVELLSFSRLEHGI